MKPLRRPMLSLAVVLATLPVASVAQSMDDIVRARLMPGWRMDNGAHMAALRIRLEPGWKTYWRAPGDAGIPPEFDWSGSQNVAAVAVHWPVPKRFDQNGLASVGYAGELVMPLEIVPDVPGRPIALSGRVQIGVCEDICVPVSLALEANLPPTGEGGGSDAIRAALADRPMTADEAGVVLVTCRAEPISDGMRLTVAMVMPPIAPEEAAVVEFSDPTVWVSEAETRREGGRLTAVAELVPAGAAPFALARDGLRFTVLGGGRAVDIRGCAAAP